MTQAVPNPSTIAPTVYSAEATALFTRMAAQPSAARKKLIDAFIQRLKANGVWSSIYSLWVPAAGETQQQALLNWQGTAARDASVSGSPTFTSGKGFSGLSSTNKVTMPTDSSVLGFGAHAFAGISANGTNDIFITTNAAATFYGINGSQNPVVAGTSMTGALINTAGNPVFFGLTSGINRALIGQASGFSYTGGFPAFTSLIANSATLSRFCALAILSGTPTLSQMRRLNGALADLLDQLGAFE